MKSIAVFGGYGHKPLAYHLYLLRPCSRPAANFMLAAAISRLFYSSLALRRKDSKAADGACKLHFFTVPASYREEGRPSGGIELALPRTLCRRVVLLRGVANRLAKEDYETSTGVVGATLLNRLMGRSSSGRLPVLASSALVPPKHGLSPCRFGRRCFDGLSMLGRADRYSVRSAELISDSVAGICRFIHCSR